MSTGQAYQFLVPVGLDDEQDDLRYPRLTSRGSVRFVAEPGDGPPVRFFGATNLVVTDLSTGKRTLSVEDDHLVCCLTDTRLVLTYRDFTARAQWAGVGVGALAAAAVNARNNRRQQADQAGYEAAMHLRLQWLTSISARSRVDILRSDSITLGVEASGTSYSVSFRIPRGPATAEQIGNDLVALTASHWLRTTLPMDEGIDLAVHRQAFERFARQRLAPVPKGPAVTVPVPASYPVGERSSRLFLQARPDVATPAPKPPAPFRPRYDGVGR